MSIHHHAQGYQLDPKIPKHAKKMYPELDEYMYTDGCLYTIMLKAMYDCVQASTLWYALIRSVIEKMGYTVGEMDKCVFVKQVGDRVFNLLLYVYDILAIVDAEEVEHLRKMLTKLFGEVQFEVSNRMS